MIRGSIQRQGAGIAGEPLAALTAALLAAAALALHALLVASGAPVPGPIGGDYRQSASTAADHYGKLPLAFEPNAGRTDQRVDFVSRGPGYSLSLAGGSALMQLESKRGTRVIGMRLAGADRSAAVAGLERLPGEVNNLVGNDPSKWRTGIPAYARVRYEDVYPGIAVDWYGRQGSLEHDFRIAAGADPGRIEMRIDGAESLRLAGNGDLVIGAAGKAIRQKAPVAFQDVHGKRLLVSSAYRVNGTTVSLRLGAYDRSLPLVIDPQILIYSSYLGGNFDDYAEAIEVDSTGSAYVTGSARDTFPTTPGVFDTTNNGVGDVFVTKLNPAGTGLVYSTFIGGGDEDRAAAIEVDSTGRAYVAGTTISDDYATTGSAYSPTDPDGAGGDDDAFISVLDASGDSLDYSTYLGDASGGNDRIGTGSSASFGGGALAIGPGNVAYVAGTTDGVSFPFEGNAFDTTQNGGDDAFLAIVDPSLSGNASVPYASFLGGIGNESAHGIDADVVGDFYVVGETSSAAFPIDGGTGTAYDSTFAGATDGFVTRIDPDVAGAGGLDYSTYLGGSNTGGTTGYDNAMAVSLAQPGQVLITGRTDANNFPTSDGAYRENDPDPGSGVNPGIDGFVTELDLADPGSGASDLLYSTYIGGGEDDIPRDVATDAAGQPVFFGTTYGAGFPVTQGAIDTSFADRDVFLARITTDPDNATPGDNQDNTDLLYSTLVGGSDTETDGGMAFDADGFAYLTTTTLSSDYPVTAGAFQSGASGFNDVGVSKLLPHQFIDGSPLNIAVDDFGRLDVSIDGEPESEIDFGGVLPRTGLVIDFGGANIRGLVGSDFIPVAPPELTGTGTAADPFVLTTVYVTPIPFLFIPQNLRITERQTYVNGELGFNSSYELQNGDISPVDVEATLAADLNIDGDDFGVGYLESTAPRFLGSLTDPLQTGDGLQEVSGWDAFQESDAGSLFAALGSAADPALSNSADPNSHDTAIAAQRSRSIPGFGTEAFQTRWQLRRVPPAIHGQKIVVQPTGGTVLVRVPGAGSFVPLLDARRIPIGSLIDVRNGFVELTAERADGTDDTATFWAGLFEAQQASGGPLDARLAESIACKAKKKKKRKKGKGRLAAAAAGATRQLWARGKGRFRTTGYRGSATIRGTEWLTLDRCAGPKRTTRFQLTEGQLEIDDFTKKGRINKILRKGSYTAPGPKGKKKKGKKK